MFGRQCQSCAMPLSQDPKGGGTEANGELSSKYCSYCYVDGQFVNPDCSVDEMVDFVAEKMREMKMARWMIWLTKKQIPRLERWRQV